MLLRTHMILLTVALLCCPPFASLAEENPEAEARRLINALGCKGCHKIEGGGGTLAPEIDQIGSRMTSTQIRNLLAAPAKPGKDSFMPSYSTTSDAELKIISDFLYNLQ